MHRIRPQSYKIFAKNRAQLYRLTLKNEKKLQNTGEKGFFIAFKKKAKISKYYILSNTRLSHIFSAIYKTCLCYLCYERL